MEKHSEVFVAFDVAKKKHAVAIAEGGRQGDEQHLSQVSIALLGDGAKPLLPPVELCLGVNPSHAAKSRPDLNTLGSGTLAAMAEAISGRRREPD
jgi:hypothetical protein